MARFLSPGWLVRHLVAAILVAGCLGLGWWQVRRAASGNLLSYAYAVEWPLFAGFVVAVWVREVRLALRPPAPAAPPPAPTPQPTAPGYVPFTLATRAPAPAAEVTDAELTAYNRYLTWLNADPARRPADYPGCAPDRKAPA